MELYKNVIAIDALKVTSEGVNMQVEGVKVQEWQKRMMIKGETEFEVLLHQYARASLKGKEPIARLLLAIHR